jgi:hypothetical protein
MAVNAADLIDGMTKDRLYYCETFFDGFWRTWQIFDQRFSANAANAA